MSTTSSAKALATKVNTSVVSKSMKLNTSHTKGQRAEGTPNSRTDRTALEEDEHERRRRGGQEREQLVEERRRPTLPA